MSQKVGFALLALACTIAYVSAACRCLSLSEDEKYCNKHFVYAFKIKDNGTVIGVDRVYKVESAGMYRTIHIDNPGTDKLFTPADSRACGSTFIKDAYYVVSGYYNEIPGQFAQMITSRCLFSKYFVSDPLPIFFPPTCGTATEI